MNIEILVNNYQLGAKVKTTPTHKIAKTERINSKQTLIRYEGITENERRFIESVLARKATII